MYIPLLLTGYPPHGHAVLSWRFHIGNCFYKVPVPGGIRTYGVVRRLRVNRMSVGYCFFFLPRMEVRAPDARAHARALIKHLIFYLVNFSMRACARAHKTPCILPCKFFLCAHARAPIKHLIFYLVNFSMRACARAHKTPYILPCKFFYARMRARP